MESLKPEFSDSDVRPEGVILPWTTPRRRPIVRIIASVTCFAFILTQSPVVRSAYAQAPQHPIDVGNLVANTASNLATFQERVQTLQEDLEQKRKVQHAIELSWLYARAGSDQNLATVVTEALRGAQAIREVMNQGVSRIQDLAGAKAGPDITGTTEFNYTLVKQPSAPGARHMKILFRDNRASTIQNEWVEGSGPGGGFWRTTTNMAYHDSGLLASYNAREYREGIPGMPGGILLLRDIKWSGHWTDNSKFYATRKTSAVRQLLDERVETMQYTTWAQSDIDRLLTKIAEVEAKSASAVEMAWAASMRGQLADGSISVGKTTQQTQVTERLFKRHERSRPLEWTQKITDSTGTTDSVVNVTYLKPEREDSDKMLATYSEVGTRHSNFVSQEDFDRYQAWMNQVLAPNSTASLEEQAAAQRLKQMIDQGQVAPNQTVESHFTIERTYDPVDGYDDKKEPTHWHEHRTSSASSIVTDTEVKLTYSKDPDHQVIKQEETTTETGHYLDQDMEKFKAEISRIEGLGSDATAAEFQWAADIQAKLDNGEISVGSNFTRTLQVVQDQYEYNEMRLPVTWMRTTKTGGTTLTERFLAYNRNELGQDKDLLVYTDEVTSYIPADQVLLRQQAKSILNNPDSTQAALEAAHQMLSFLNAGGLPQASKRSSIRYRTNVTYNAAGLPISYTEYSTTNADRLLTISEVQGVVYDRQGRELMSVAKNHRTGSSTRLAYRLADGTELTPEELRRLLEENSSNGNPAHVATLEELVAQGLILVDPNVPFVLDQNWAVYRHDTQYDGLGRLFAVTEDTTNPTDLVPTTTQILGITYDSKNRQDASLSIVHRLDPNAVRSALFDSQGQELDEYALEELLQNSGTSLADLIAQGLVVRQEVAAPLDQTIFTYRSGAHYYGDSTLLEGARDLINTRGYNQDGVTEIQDSSLTLYDDAGRVKSQFLLGQRQGLGKMSVFFVDGQEMTYGLRDELLKEAMRAYKKDHNLPEDAPNPSLKELFGAGYITQNPQNFRSIFVNTRTETFRHDVEYDPATGFLIHQVDMNAQVEMNTGDFNQGVTKVTFKNAAYTPTGQLLMAQTDTDYDLFGLEGNKTKVLTLYHRTPQGALRFAEAVGTQETFDFFGNGSISLLSQYFLGIGGQAKLAANVAAGWETTLEGSQFQIQTVNASRYDPQGNLVGATGFSLHVGSDIYGNWSSRRSRILQGIIDGNARNYIIYSENPDQADSNGQGSNVSNIQGGAPADFLINPGNYNQVLVADYGAVKIIQYIKISDGSLAGVVLNLAGDQRILSSNLISVGPDPVTGKMTIEGATFRYTFDTQTINGVTHVITTRITKGSNGAPDTLNEIVDTWTDSNGFVISEYRNVTQVDQDNDPTTPAVDMKTLTRRTTSLGLMTVTEFFVRTDPNEPAVSGGGEYQTHLSGTVSVTGPGFSNTFNNVSGVSTVTASGVQKIQLQTPSETDTVSFDQTTGVYTVDRSTGGLTTLMNRIQLVQHAGETTLVSANYDSSGNLTQVTYTDQRTQTVWMTVYVATSSAGAAQQILINGQGGFGILNLSNPQNVTFDNVTGMLRFNATDPSGTTTWYQIEFSSSSADVQLTLYGDSAYTTKQSTYMTQWTNGILTTQQIQTGTNQILRTIRVVEGPFSNTITYYRGPWVTDDTLNTLERKIVYFPSGFVREDIYTDVNGQLVWNNGVQVVTERKITYLTPDGTASQTYRILYDYQDPNQWANPTGAIRSVYRETYDKNGATTEILEVARTAAGDLDWGQKQYYDFSGNRVVAHVQRILVQGDDPTTTTVETQYYALRVAGIFTRSDGSTTRLFLIPNNKILDASGQVVRQMVEFSNGQNLSQLTLWADASVADPSSVTLTQVDWETLLSGGSINQGGVNFWLDQAAGRTAVTLNVPAPMAIRMPVKILSYTTAAQPDLTSLDIVRLAWSKQITVPYVEDKNGNGILDPGEDINGNGLLDQTTNDPQKVLAYFRSGKEITVPWQGGQVKIQQASLSLSTLSDQEQTQLLSGTLSLIQRQMVQIVNSSSGTTPDAGVLAAFGQYTLSEAERNSLMQGATVHIDLGGGLWADLYSLHPVNNQVIEVVSGTMPAGGLTLAASDVTDLTNGKQVTVGGVTLRLRSLTQQESQDLSIGRTITAWVLNGNAVQNSSLGQVQANQPYVRVIGNYFGTVGSFGMSQAVNNGVVTRTFTFGTDDPNTPQDERVTITVTLSGFTTAWRQDYSGTLVAQTTLDLGWLLTVVGWDDGQGTVHTVTAADLPPSLSGVRLTPQELANLQAGQAVTLMLPDGKTKVTLQKSAVSIAGLSSQQSKDLKAGRYLVVQGEVVATVNAGTDTFDLTDAQGASQYRVQMDRDSLGNLTGTFRVNQVNPDGTIGPEITATLSQQDQKAIKDALD